MKTRFIVITNLGETDPFGNLLGKETPLILFRIKIFHCITLQKTSQDKTVPVHCDQSPFRSWPKQDHAIFPRDIRADGIWKCQKRS